MRMLTLAEMDRGIPVAKPSQLFVPVRARDVHILDSSGELVCVCFTPELAKKVEALLNQDAGISFGRLAR